MYLSQQLISQEQVSSQADELEFENYAPQVADSALALLAKIAGSSAAGGGGGGTVSGDPLERGSDSISADPFQYSTVSSSSILSGSGTVFTLASGEKGFIQNLNTGALAVKYGTSASSTSFNFILNPASTLDYGGGSSQIDDYIGAVSVSPIAGASNVRYVAYKLS